MRPEKVMTKKNASDLTELSRLKRCQDTGEVTAAAERLRKKVEDEYYDELTVAGVSE